VIAMTRFLLLAGVLAGTACGTARSQQVYAADAGRLLESRNDQLQRCYNEALKTQPDAKGTVTVKFVVEPKSGAIKDATVDPARTTAPEALDRCVLDAMAGLTLAPPDRNEGRATFVYEVKANPPPAAPAAG